MGDYSGPGAGPQQHPAPVIARSESASDVATSADGSTVLGLLPAEVASSLEDSLLAMTVQRTK